MEDIAPGLLEEIRNSFTEKVSTSPKIAKLYKAIQDGTATYIEAEEYAYEVGAALAEAFGEHLSSAVLPDGKMYYNIADRVVRPLLEDDHAIIADAATKVQTALNEKAGIHLKAQAVPVDNDRIDGIVNKVSVADNFDDVAWVLDEPVKTYSQAVVDSTLRANVDFQGRAGRRPKIIRKSEWKCCDWCRHLAGEYEYPDVPDDIYRRHERCRCRVLFDPADGKRSFQNVHTKRWTDGKENDILEKRRSIPGIVQDHRKKYPINPDTGYQYTRHPVVFSDAQFGKKVGKHAADFGMQPDIQEDRDRMRAIIENIVENAEERCFGDWAGQESPVLFHILGDDVVIESKYQEFVTVLKGGTSSARVKKARGK